MFSWICHITWSFPLFPNPRTRFPSKHSINFSHDTTPDHLSTTEPIVFSHSTMSNERFARTNSWWLLDCLNLHATLTWKHMHWVRESSRFRYNRHWYLQSAYEQEWGSRGVSILPLDRLAECSAPPCRSYSCDTRRITLCSVIAPNLHKPTSYVKVNPWECLTNASCSALFSIFQSRQSNRLMSDNLFSPDQQMVLPESGFVYAQKQPRIQPGQVSYFMMNMSNFPNLKSIETDRFCPHQGVALALMGVKASKWHQLESF